MRKIEPSVSGEHDSLHLFAEEVLVDQYGLTAEDLTANVDLLSSGCFSSFTTFGTKCGTASSLGCLATLSG